MRANNWCLVVVAVAGCKPSATVENTLPVANLQSYRTVGLRVRSTAFASQGLAVQLETQTIGYLRQKCGFESVAKAEAGSTADVVLDLNIASAGRGGGGVMVNSSQATLETLLVLTDGQSGEIMGTARIRGKSSGMIINNARPENEAIDVVAKTVADVLFKSGCAGPRIAKAVPPVDEQPPATGDAGAAPDETKRAAADALNEQGKEKLRSDDVPGALAAFQQANTTLPDPRYQYNVCIALEAQEQWQNAIQACQQAKSMGPQATLSGKIDARITLISNHLK